MQQGKKQQHFRITLEFDKGMTRTVNVRAASREVAEARAVKRHPSALRVRRA